MKPYGIILADSYTMVREGIRNIINTTEGLAVIGEATDGLALIELTKKNMPDMIILDIILPGMRGIEAVCDIKAYHHGLQVIFLSEYVSRELLSLALHSGANGYLLKKDSSKDLIEAIGTVRKGRTYVSKSVVAEYPTEIIDIYKGHHSGSQDPLSHRERQILMLIAEGKTDRQIAQTLFISLRTAQRHHFNIRTKLDMKHIAQLVKYAISMGYILPP